MTLTDHTNAVEENKQEPWVLSNVFLYIYCLSTLACTLIHNCNQYVVLAMKCYLCLDLSRFQNKWVQIISALYILQNIYHNSYCKIFLQDNYCIMYQLQKLLLSKCTCLIPFYLPLRHSAFILRTHFGTAYAT